MKTITVNTHKKAERIIGILRNQHRTCWYDKFYGYGYLYYVIWYR